MRQLGFVGAWFNSFLGAVATGILHFVFIFFRTSTSQIKKVFVIIHELIRVFLGMENSGKNPRSRVCSRSCRADASSFGRAQKLFLALGTHHILIFLPPLWDLEDY